MKKHPQYRISFNKAVDRYLLIELIHFAEKTQCIDMKKADYFSLGGPFLVDQRIIHSFFPNTKLHSIENDVETFKRQKKHRFCKNIELIRKEVTEYINETSFDKQVVFWLDFTKISKEYLDSLSILAYKAPIGSIIKVTFNASLPTKPTSETPEHDLSTFRRKYNNYLPTITFEQISDEYEYCLLMYNAVINAIAKLQMEREEPGFFVPCSFIRYSDISPMMSVSGILINKERKKEIQHQLKKYSFFSPDIPELIDMPDLSNIERHFINQKLPTNNVDNLFNALGYSLQRDEAEPFDGTKAMLKSYAKFWHKFPEFVQAVLY